MPLLTSTTFSASVVSIHKIRSLLYRNHLAEGTLYLPRDLEMVEYRLFVVIELDDLFLVRRYLGDVFRDFFKLLPVIDIDIGECVIEKVSQYSGGLAVFCEKQLDALVLGNLRPCTFPFAYQRFKFCYENLRRSCLLQQFL